MNQSLSGPGTMLAPKLPHLSLAEVLTPDRIKRTILTATFPDSASIRPAQAIVEAALNQRPSIGAISELRLDAGRMAGRVLAGMDYSSVGPVIIGRDELFFPNTPLLLVIEPVSMRTFPRGKRKGLSPFQIAGI